MTTSKFTKPTQKSPQQMLHQFNYVSFFNSFRANLTPTYFHTLFPTATHNSIPHSLYIYVYYSTFLPESLPHKSLSLSLSLTHKLKSMATIAKSGIWVLVVVVGLMVSPSESQTCSSLTVANKVFSNCSALPHLGAYLHWTYNASNSTLSMAFSAKPPQADGWVAWAINPTSTKMAGSQALLAHKPSGSTPTVKEYNITSYNFSAAGNKLTYEVSDLSSEESDGTITIFAKWKLPDKTEKINQVWQVGPIMQGLPGIHVTTGENLLSGQALQLAGSGASTSPTASPAPAPGSSTPGSLSPAPSNGSTPSSTSRITVGFNMGLLFSFFSVASLMGL